MSGPQRIVVIGVGNEYRRDDGTGPAVLHMLRDLMPAGVELVPSDGEPTSLMEAWTGASAAIVIDAVAGGPAASGTLHRLDVTAGPGQLPADRGASSHGLGPASAVALARQLDRMPATLIVHGIEGADFSHGVGLSPAVAARVGELAAAVLSDVRAACG